MSAGQARRPDRPPGRARDGGPDTASPGHPMTSAADQRAEVSYTVTRWGCPCGCRTWLPWIDDPDCIRHRPVPPPREQPELDAETLGLVPHNRATCAACRAVGR